MVERLRFGVLGETARIYQGRLRPAFAASSGAEVVAGASRTATDLSAYAELLARPDLDAVYIPLPNLFHAPWIERALEAGKHVLCEKPLTMTAAATDAAFATAERTGRTLIEAYMWPHHPRARLIRHLATELGTLRHLHSAFTFALTSTTDHRVDERGDGALLDVGIYCIAPAMLLAGRDPVSWSATSVLNDHDVDVTTTGSIDWGSGFTSTFDVSFECPDRRSLEISGTEGFLSLPPDAEMPGTPAWHAPGPETDSIVTVRRRDGAVEHHASPGANAFVEMIDQFCRVVAGTEAPVFGPTESRRLARTLDGLRSSGRQPPSTRP